MKELVENATARARMYPASYKVVSSEAKKRRTSIAQVLHELIRKEFRTLK